MFLSDSLCVSASPSRMLLLLWRSVKVCQNNPSVRLSGSTAQAGWLAKAEYLPFMKNSLKLVVCCWLAAFNLPFHSPSERLYTWDISWDIWKYLRCLRYFEISQRYRYVAWDIFWIIYNVEKYVSTMLSLSWEIFYDLFWNILCHIDLSDFEKDILIYPRYFEISRNVQEILIV